MGAESTDRVSKYLQSRREHLALLEAMWSDPKVQLYNDAELPPHRSPSVFLNGPTSRHQFLELNHRCLSVKYLREAGFRGWIFVPEPRGQEEVGDFTKPGYIYEWESSRRARASCNSFWIPYDSSGLLGLNVDLALGIELGKVVTGMYGPNVFIGWTDDAVRMGLPSHYRLYRNQRVMCEQIALTAK